MHISVLDKKLNKLYLALFRFCIKNVHPCIYEEREGHWAAGGAVGDPCGVCHQLEAAHGANEHEQCHGKQHVSYRKYDNYDNILPPLSLYLPVVYALFIKREMYF